MAYVISRSGCYRFPWINREVQAECGRCGLLYRFQHFCKALTRKCYICHNYGHYSRFCHHQHVAARTTVAACQVKQQTKVKSTKKQARDHNRLVLFRQRKSVCMIMPFYDISTPELPKLLPTVQEELKELYLENSLPDLAIDRLPVSLSTEETDRKKAELEASLAATDKIQKLTDDLEHQVSVNMQDISETVSDLSRRCECLQKEIEDDKIQGTGTQHLLDKALEAEKCFYSFTDDLLATIEDRGNCLLTELAETRRLNDKISECVILCLQYLHW